MHPHLMDLDGVARTLAVSSVTARRWASDGRIPGVRIGGQWRFWAPAVLTRAVGPEAASHVPALPPGHTDPTIVGTAQLAELLGIHEQTVTVLLRKGAIPATKVGHQWRAYWPNIRDRIAAGLPLIDPTEPEAPS